MSTPPRADVSAFRRAAATLAELGEGLDAVLEAETALDAAEVALPLLDAAPFGALPEVPEVSGSAKHSADAPDAPRASRAPAPPEATRSAESRPAIPLAPSRRRAWAEAASSGDGPGATEPAAPRSGTAAGDPVDAPRSIAPERPHASASLRGEDDGGSDRATGRASPRLAGPTADADEGALVAAILSIEAANGATAGPVAEPAGSRHPWLGAVRAFRGAGRGLGALPDLDALLGSDDVLATAEAPLPLADASPFDAVSADAVPQPRDGRHSRRGEAATKRRAWPEPPVAPTRRSPSAPDAPRRDRIGQADVRATGEPKPAAETRGAIGRPSPERAATTDARPVHRLGRRPAERGDAVPVRRESRGDAADSSAQSVRAPRSASVDRLTRAGSAESLDSADRLAGAAWEAEDGGERRTLLADLSEAVLRVARGGDRRIATPRSIAPEIGPGPAAGGDGSTRHPDEVARPASRSPAAHPTAPVAESRAGQAPAVSAAPRVGRSLRLLDTLARSVLASRTARESAWAGQLARMAAMPSPETAVREAPDVPEPASRGGGWEPAHAAVAALDAAVRAEAGLPAPTPVAPGVAKPHAFTPRTAPAELPLDAGIDAQAALDAGALASLVNDALVEQALRHGVDLS